MVLDIATGLREPKYATAPTKYAKKIKSLHTCTLPKVKTAKYASVQTYTEVCKVFLSSGSENPYGGDYEANTDGSVSGRAGGTETCAREPDSFNC